MKVSILCGTLVAAGLIGIAASPLAAQQRRSNSSTYTEKPDPLAPGKKAVHDAMVDVNKAQLTMSQLKQRVEKSMESKDDWKAAKTARDQAHAEYDAASRSVMDNLKKNPDYAAAVKQRNELQTQMDAAQGSTKLSDEELTKLATDRAKVGITIANMEKTAKENDGKVQEAKAKVAKADEDWKGLMGQVDDALKSDTEYAKAEKDLEAANDKLKQARASLATQAKAQREAELAADRARSNSQSSGGGGGGGGYRR